MMSKHLHVQMWIVLLYFIFLLYLPDIIGSELFWVFKNLIVGWFYFLCFHLKGSKGCYGALSSRDYCHPRVHVPLQCDIATPPIHRCGWFLYFLESGLALWLALIKKIMAEGILYDFQGLTFKCFAVSGFSLLEYHPETTRPGRWTILLEYGGQLRSPSWRPDPLQGIWAKPSCISQPSQSFRECRFIKKPSRGTFQLTHKTMRNNTLLCVKPPSLGAVCFIPIINWRNDYIYIYLYMRIEDY